MTPTSNTRRSTRPMAATTGFPRSTTTRTRPSSSPSSATTARIRLAFRSARWARPSSLPTASCWWIRTYCLGCRYCIQACPYGCRFLNPKTNTADKCTLCYHRITQGLTTACCEACPTQARVLADLKNPKDPIHEFLRTHSVQVLKPQMATHAKVFYKNLDGSVR